MAEITLAPYFHPTTICLVDDNEPFLHSLSLELPESWACQLFTDPFEALAYLNEPPALAPLVDRCFSLEPPTDSEALIHLDLNLIEQEINHPERFRRVSVVVADYAMPSMNGVELCRRAADPYLKKAMLTGVADEKLAVQAFNEGLIHRFIPKHGSEAIHTTIDYIAELQLDYFNQYTARLQSTLSINPPPFLIDAGIAAWMDNLRQAEHLVEYYLVDNPPGFMLLRSNGAMLRALVLDAADMNAQLDFVKRHGAPTEVVQDVAAKRAAGLFAGDSPANYFGSEPYPWRENMAPISRVTGERDWYIGIVNDAPADIDFDPDKASYDAYLRTLD